MVKIFEAVSLCVPLCRLCRLVFKKIKQYKKLKRQILAGSDNISLNSTCVCVKPLSRCKSVSFCVSFCLEIQYSCLFNSQAHLFYSFYFLFLCIIRLGPQSFHNNFNCFKNSWHSSLTCQQNAKTESTTDKSSGTR